MNRDFSTNKARERAARKAEWRTYIAHSLCALVCLGTTTVFVVMGLLLWPDKPILSFYGLVVFGGIFVSLMAALLFLLDMRDAGKDAYFAVLFARS